MCSVCSGKTYRKKLYSPPKIKSFYIIYYRAMIIRIFAGDEVMKKKLITLGNDALAHEKMKGEVLVITPEENKKLYKLEIDPTIVIDDQLVIEEFIPTVEELAQVIRMQKQGGHTHEGCHEEHDDDSCGGNSCGSCDCH